MFRRYLFLVILSALALSACAVGPDFHRPAPLTMTGYTREPLAPASLVSGTGRRRTTICPGLQIFPAGGGSSSSRSRSTSLVEEVAPCQSHHRRGKGSLRQALENV